VQDWDLCLIVDENVEAADAEDEIGAKQLGGGLAGEDESRVVELRLRKAETTAAAAICISIGGSSRRAVTSILPVIPPHSIATAATAAAAAVTGARKFEATQATHRRNVRTGETSRSHCARRSLV